MQDVHAHGGSGAPGAAGPAPDERSRWRIWTTPKAAGLHVTLAIVVPAFLGLFWWQVQRVRQGNTLSWAYVFEWPFFTGYAVYLWWKLIHDQLDDPATVRTRPGWHRVLGADAGSGSGSVHANHERAGDDLGERPIAPAASTVGSGAGAAGPAYEAGTGAEQEDVDEEYDVEEEEDEELAAYNRYLAELNASGRPKRW